MTKQSENGGLRILTAFTQGCQASVYDNQTETYQLYQHREATGYFQKGSFERKEGKNPPNILNNKLRQNNIYFVKENHRGQSMIVMITNDIK